MEENIYMLPEVKSAVSWDKNKESATPTRLHSGVARRTGTSFTDDIKKIEKGDISYFDSRCVYFAFWANWMCSLPSLR